MRIDGRKRITFPKQFEFSSRNVSLGNTARCLPEIKNKLIESIRNIIFNKTESLASARTYLIDYMVSDDEAKNLVDILRTELLAQKPVNPKTTIDFISHLSLYSFEDEDTGENKFSVAYILSNSFANAKGKYIDSTFKMLSSAYKDMLEANHKEVVSGIVAAMCNGYQLDLKKNVLFCAAEQDLDKTIQVMLKPMLDKSINNMIRYDYAKEIILEMFESRKSRDRFIILEKIKWLLGLDGNVPMSRAQELLLSIASSDDSAAGFVGVFLTRALLNDWLATKAKKPLITIYKKNLQYLIEQSLRDLINIGARNKRFKEHLEDVIVSAAQDDQLLRDNVYYAILEFSKGVRVAGTTQTNIPKQLLNLYNEFYPQL